MPIQARVQVSHKGIKRLSSSIELGAQYVSPHQNQRDHTCRKRTCLLPSFAHAMYRVKSSSCSCKKEGVSGSSEWLHLKERRSLGSLGHPEQQEIAKWLKNSTAIGYTLLKRITRLKCVNSEFRSVDIHPKQGCLKWPYGTMSESP